MYDLDLMLFANVDSLSKSVITGFILAPSEQANVVVRAAKKFSLDREGTVLMTDEASAFASAAATLKKKHILCRKGPRKRNNSQGMYQLGLVPSSILCLTSYSVFGIIVNNFIKCL
jgi:hypothetical protein